MRRAWVALLLLAALALAPAGAAAQSDPIRPLPAPAPEPLPAPAPVDDPDDGGMETWQELLIYGAAAAMLGGIAWWVVRDARHRAPVEELGPPEAGSGRRSPEDRRKAKQRARKAGKQARQARRRNR